VLWRFEQVPWIRNRGDLVYFKAVGKRPAAF
jgi:hypothetical protein